ncbi:hypothetical protein GGI15_001343 [Coemansia interrupta]|uniref:Uncharacterized protein n=1 Tax=Coemansia interrupta TaxID=1126814 RepID=A0A9W8HI72_9FUNG|nr:hypothetical protein GGI15_001343 [Coemansia interrupta]
MPAADNDLTELFIRSFKCTGDVPPALVGSSVAYLDGKAYVFGGRALHSGKLSNDTYVCELRNFAWRRIDTEAGSNDNSVAPPSPRFFHSCTAFKHYLIVFGGMGLDAEADGLGGSGGPSGAASPVGAAPPQSIQDDRQQQSFQMRTTKTLLGDVSVFDTLAERWVALRALEDPEADNAQAAAAAGGGSGMAPSPRYAHLATLFGSRLLVVGGQDLEEQYVEELNVFDLQLGRWVLRSPFPRAVGLYRSFVASVPGTDTTLLYSNYSFASVKRALYSLSAPPDCTLKEISDQLSGDPPGLRFPRGHLVDPHTLVMTGTLISTEGHSELSLWTLDARAMRWEPIPCGAKFRTGSWNQSVIDPRTNTLVLFGDSRRDLTYDYQRRRLNYSEIRTVDLRALGFLRVADPEPTLEPVGAAVSAAVARAASSSLMRAGSVSSNSASPVSPTQALLAGNSASTGLGVELGLQFLFFSQYGDAEIIGSDGMRIAAVNSGILRARWPAQAQVWLVADADSANSGKPAADDVKRAHRRTHRPESSLISGDYDVESEDSVALVDAGPKRFFIEAAREVVCVLLFYLYTDRIDPQARFGLHAVGADSTPVGNDEVAVAGVLGDLLVVARKYSLNKLALRTVNLLRYKVNETTAPLIYEAALRADHHGLQARCVIALRDHIGSFRIDRKSTLYMITNASRASLIRYFPKLNVDDGSGSFAEDAQTLSSTANNGYSNSSQYQQQQQQNHYQQSVYSADSRQRSTSDAFLGGAFPTPSPSASPASTLRSNQTRSPFMPPEHGAAGAHPRRPWEATMMGSPVVNSPAVSARYNGNGNQLYDSRNSGANGPDGKRLSNVSPLVNQSLPEDSAVNYGNDSLAGHSEPAPQTSGHSNKSNRVSRYLGGGGMSLDSNSERRPSDSSASETSSLHMLQQQHQQFQQQQQQPPPQTSSRSLIFRPWSKMKKIASSGQVSSDSLPPMPNNSSNPSYAGN